MTTSTRFGLCLKYSYLMMSGAFLLFSQAMANQLVIQPGGITCAIDPEVPVIVDSNGDIHVRVLDIGSDDCLGNAPTELSEPSLSVRVREAEAPGEVRLLWDGSDGAESCMASSEPTLDEWDGPVSAETGQRLIISDLSADTYEFRLLCSRGDLDSPQVSETAEIRAAGDPAACDSRPPPRDWNRLTNSCVFVIGSGFQGDCTSWDAIFGGGFDEVNGRTRRIATNRQDPFHYLALEFRTGDITPTQRGSLTSDSAGGMMDSRRRIYSISTCPGDFHQEAVMEETGCYGQLTSIFHLFWGGEESGRQCQLQPNTTYYLNLISTNSALGTNPRNLVPNCPNGDNCGAVYDPQQGN